MKKQSRKHVIDGYKATLKRVMASAETVPAHLGVVYFSEILRVGKDKVTSRNIVRQARPAFYAQAGGLIGKQTGTLDFS